MGKRSAAREEFLHDVLVTAVEGGIDYWADTVDVVQVDAPEDILGWRYGSVTVLERHEEESEPYTITIETIAHGLQRIRKENPSSRLCRETDAGDLDAYDADIIVQYGLFGTQVYA